MNNFELVKFGDARELAHTAAREWLNDIVATIAKRAPYCVALSGGRIAGTFFSEVADLAKAARDGLDAVHFFWGDERCVPPDDPESNFGLARKRLLEPLTIADEKIHRIHGEALPNVAAVDAEKELRRVSPGTLDGQPVFDMVFLGMGEEGHVASLFPGESEAMIASPSVYRAVTATKPPPHRITLGYPAISSAKKVWVLVSGSGKETALRESLGGKGRTPLAHILRLRPHTRIFSDLA